MKLSEAIRLGSMLGPQARGSLNRTIRTGFLGLFGPSVTAYCALGAAHAAVGATSETRTAQGGEIVATTPFRGAKQSTRVRKTGEKYSVIVQDAFDRDPSWQFVACPVCAKFSGEVFRVIPHLNDGHRWTREQIADWIEGLEAQAQPSELTVSGTVEGTAPVIAPR